MNKVELLAPAGDLERLKWAILYGADAVYIGGENYSLRANAINFNLKDIKEGVEYAHKHNAKVYVTVNIIFHNKELKGLLKYLKELEKIKVDAIIVSDLFVIDFIKENNINLEIHLSTQACTINSEAAKFYKKEGIKRLVLARECSKEDIKSIIKTKIDTEVFIHGAMCMGYSGKCTLSNHFTNRDSNRGGCAQICRWAFDLQGLKTNDVKFCLAPKDLSLLKYIPDLIDLGVKSFKIEGRMKSVYYIATLISVYRRAIDRYYEIGEYEYNKKDELELFRCANRDSVSQYFDKKPGAEEQYYIGRQEVTNQDFLGVVLDYDNTNKEIILEERNYFKVGDKINIFGPKKESFSIEVEYIKNEEGKKIEYANHPKEILRIPCKKEVSKYDIIRVDFLN